MKLIHEPKVERIASTSMNEVQFARLTNYMDSDPSAGFSEDLIEFAGRSCYQSFHKPNEATRSNKDYIANIICQGHESVLEHASVTYYIQGVSRNLTHELVRHRHFSFSQQSQRFVDESEAAFVVPPALCLTPLVGALEELADDAIAYYEHLAKELDLPRKQVREAARCVLPGMLETRIVVTGNHRTWREFLWKRLAPGADAEIRRLAQVILEDLYTLAPAVYQDVWDKYGVIDDS